MINPTDYQLDLPASPEEIKEELRKRADKEWVTVTLSSNSGWVKDATRIWFRSRFIYLMPLEGGIPAYATTPVIDKETNKDTLKILYAFFSSLSWLEAIPLSIQQWSVSGLRPSPLGYRGSSISLRISFIDKDYLQDPQDEKARLALALYRDGLSINNTFYSFLSFFKIINIVNKSGEDHKKWIDSKLTRLSYEAKQRLKELEENSKNNIGEYLYESGRCAVAHAWEEPIADPDNPDDQERLRKDKILIKELSALLIEEEFGVKSRQSLYKDGKHRTQKLLNIFDEQLLKKGILKTKLPFIKLNIRGKTQNQLTEKLYFPEKVNFYRKTIIIDTFSQNRRAMIRFFIDTEKNDLFINVDYACYKLTDDKDKTNAEIDLNALILMRDYLMNGQIRIYSPDGELLASSTPYIPNLVLGRSLEDLNQCIEAARLKLATFL